MVELLGIGQSGGGAVGRSGSQAVGWLVGRAVGWSCGLAIGRLVGQVVGWSGGWSDRWTVGQASGVEWRWYMDPYTPLKTFDFMEFSIKQIDKLYSQTLSKLISQPRIILYSTNLSSINSTQWITTKFGII